MTRMSLVRESEQILIQNSHEVGLGPNNFSPSLRCFRAPKPIGPEGPGKIIGFCHPVRTKTAISEEGWLEMAPVRTFLTTFWTNLTPYIRGSCGLPLRPHGSSAQSPPPSSAYVVRSRQHPLLPCRVAHCTGPTIAPTTIVRHASPPRPVSPTTHHSHPKCQT